MSSIAEYKESILNWDWEKIATTCRSNADVEFETGDFVGSCFLGSCFALCPSGKYYMPWACSNVTQEEAEEDEDWQAALEEIAESHGMFIESGEGDPCDIFACKIFDEGEDPWIK
jgi:heterodisulfide reductase subunit C